MSESRPEPDRTGWLSPEAVEAWEQPLPPAEHVLPPDQRRTRYQAQAARAEQRRMLADGEAGDIVAIDSGRRPRVIGVPVDYTLVVRRWDPQDWLDYEADSVSARIDTRETARRLATRIGTPPAGPWALVVTGLSPIHSRSSSNWQTREYFDALGIELRELGLTGLDRVAMVRHHGDLRDWQRDLRVRPQLAEYGGPVHAFRPEGFLANGLDDLLTTVTRALHNRPQPRCPANPQPRHLPVTATR
ncbi:hypothetical protein [Streptomyces sp. NPDC046942]|uniref:hypothetical protein n=1 Tax=Streptomyces sp. NPDC046942 TaxID=3155137 RepID=UPI0033D918D7